MSLFHSLTEKPWLAEVGAVAENQSGTLSSERIALRFFLGAVSILFFLFIITFLSRSQFPDFIPLSGQPWQPFTDASQLWINTSILVMASIAMQAGVIAAKKMYRVGAVVAVFVALLMSVGFITAQMMVWQQLSDLGFYVSGNPANSFYYLLTAIHGVHLLGGVAVLLRCSYRFFSNQSMEQLQATLSLCASYWHYLLVLWLVLFSLLTSSADTYAYIAALCGF
jgi:cytochrome c oxidase subunit 3